jgi:hypothetical protein
MSAMRVRVLSLLLIALLAFPASWAAPVLVGAHPAHTASSDAPPCDSHEGHTNDDCPCCPEHSGSMSDCLSVCALAVGMPAVTLPTLHADGSMPPPVHVAAAFSSRSDSPFKPPPIL